MEVQVLSRAQKYVFLHSILKDTIKHKFFNITITAVLLLLYTSFLYRNIVAIDLGSISPTTIIFIAMETTVIALLLIRKNPVDRATDIKSWFFAFSGTFLPLLLIPTGVVLNGDLGNVFMLLGGLLAIGSYLSLNTSFGISPALREVKTGGLYHFVRHPMYLSYIILFTGYINLAFSWFNFVIFISIILCLIIRIIFEEKILNENLGYKNYSTKVRYKIIPFIY